MTSTKTLPQIREAVENLPRYTGTKWTNGPAEWSLAFCKKLDALSLLSADLADDVIAAGMLVRTPVAELRRGDLILRRWAGGRNSIDVVVEVVPAPETDSGGREMGGFYVRTTNSGGKFRTISQMWTTSEFEERIDVPRPTSIVIEEADALLALKAEVADETVEKCPLCGEALSGSVAEFVDGDGDVYHEPCIEALLAEDAPAVHRAVERDDDVDGKRYERLVAPAVGDVVRFEAEYSTGVLVDGGPTAPYGYETVVEEYVESLGDDDQPYVLVRFPETSFGFSPRQYVPASVVSVSVRVADLDSEVENDDDDPTSVFAEFGPDDAPPAGIERPAIDPDLEALLWEGAPADEVGPFDSDVCRHETRTTISYYGISTGKTHEMVCPDCGHVFAELLLVDVRALRPGDAMISNDDDDLLPPYWVVEKIVPSRYDGEFEIVATKDGVDGIVRRQTLTSPSCLIVAVLADLHRSNVERSRERNARILDSLALAVFSTDSYHDGSGDWEIDALVRDFRNAGGGHELDDDTIFVAIEAKFESLRRQVHSVARDLMAASVDEAVRSAAPERFSAVWADALVRVAGELDRVPPTTKFLRDARVQVLDSKGR